ncbi:MAG: Mur ligase family protein [Microscillaceae bacterium]|nr:Mur ligase family protein [Microscillaceae bacterium]MDW8461260.1 Mur ligase family protein [Cytophagales bacterium]
MQTQAKKVHFIAIGGSVMHNLALELLSKGYQVSGSDDEIFEPAKSHLAAHNLLPEQLGWFPDKVTPDLEAVIVGMHAKADNPELQKALSLNLRVYSFPEYIYQHCQNKHRIVIAGSHGKTTITAIIMHVLKVNKRKFDYVVGSKLEGFERTVSLNPKNPTIIIEGDEYPSSPLDKTPKFLHYKHHIAVITGIAWDHYNVFPTFESYLKPFEDLVNQSEKGGFLIYSKDDKWATKLCTEKEIPDVMPIGYHVHNHKIVNGQTILIAENGNKYPIQIFGEHNLRNISAAHIVCDKIGITEEEFYEALTTFKGAAQRLEKFAQNEYSTFFRDFAHAPSKVQATVKAVKTQFPKRKLVACLELHSYSSLNTQFIPQYKNTLKDADVAIVYFNPKTLKNKNLHLTEDQVRQAFAYKNLIVMQDSQALWQWLQEQNWENKNLLLMSSGNFDNLNFEELAKKL